MKTETLTIPVYKVRVGDRVWGELVTKITPNASCWTLIAMKGFESEAKILSEWPITVIRRIPDECPRGELELIDGGNAFKVDGKHLTYEEELLVYKRLAKMWNDAEDDKTLAVQINEADWRAKYERLLGAAKGNTVAYTHYPKTCECGICNLARVVKILEHEGEGT